MRASDKEGNTLTTDGEILQAIETYHGAFGYPPSFRDISAITGIKAPSAVRYRLMCLREKGLIDYVDGKPRTVKVTSHVD